MATTFGIDPDLAIMTSAKKMIGIKAIIEAVIDQLPSPMADSSIGKHTHSDHFLARIVDSWFDAHRGVVCLIQNVAGVLTESQRITTIASVKESQDVDNKTEFSIQEIGVLAPASLRTGRISIGQVGYIIAGMRSTRQARIGVYIYCLHSNGPILTITDAYNIYIYIYIYVHIYIYIYIYIYYSYYFQT